MTETDKLNDLNYQVILSSSSLVSTIINDSSFCNNFLWSHSRFSDSSKSNLNVGITATDTKYEFTNGFLSSVFLPYLLHSDATCNILVCRSIIDNTE